MCETDEVASPETEVELQLRQLIFDRLADIVAEKGVVTRAELESFDAGGVRRRLIDRNRGIWNPRDLEATLSVLSSPQGPYEDSHIGDSLYAYDYRAGRIDGDNRKLRRAYELGLPIIMLRKIRDGIFVSVFPVYVVADDGPNRKFILALDESLRFVSDPLHLTPDEREYAQRVTRQRLHQPEFRGKVLQAYETRCSRLQLAARQTPRCRAHHR